MVYRGVTCCRGYKKALHCQKHHHSAVKVTEQNIQQKTWVRNFMLYSQKNLKEMNHNKSRKEHYKYLLIIFILSALKGIKLVR